MNKNNTNYFAFVLGRETDLALAELNSVLDRFNFCFDVFRISGNIAFAKIESEGRENELESAFQSLGGTIKVFQIRNTKSKIRDKYETLNSSPKSENNKAIKQYSNEIATRFFADAQNDIASVILEHKNTDQKFNFGISDYSGTISIKQINDLGLKIKQILKKKGYKTRFVALKDKSELSSILSLKNDLVDRGIEIGLFENRIGRLVYLNDPEKWNERDYGKPAGDKFSGMLPPKLARMMINLALAESTKHEALNSKQTQNKEIINSKHVSDFGFCISDLGPKPLVLDPFCGSGNVAMEALMLGCDVITSDISKKAVEDTKQNIAWLKSKILSTKSQTNTKFEMPNTKMFQADATSDELLNILNAEYSMLNAHDNFVVVTEPFLGKPKKFKPTIFEAEREYSKVKELYINFFKNIATFYSSSLPSRQAGEARSSQPAASNNNPLTVNRQPLTICIVFPLIEMKDGKKYSLFARCVDELGNLGYTQACKSYIYGRDYQVVKREIALLKYESRNTKSETNSKH